MAKGAAQGRPKDFKSGQPDAIWIWFDNDAWHVRATTATPDIRDFTGRLWIGEGSISDLKLISIDHADAKSRDTVRSTARAIEFDFNLGGQVDGFDYKLTGTQCIRFKLLYQGKAIDPKLVKIGEKQVNPPAATFRLCQ